MIPGYRNETRRRIARGLGITASGADTVQLDRGAFDYDGSRKFVAQSTSAAISQQDSASAALASGESYYITVSINSSGTTTLTKGTKSATPTKPAVPSNEILRGYIRVHYQSGGTSVIATADVDTTAVVRGDYYVEAGTGLAVKIHGGDAISTSDTYRWHEATTTLSVTASSTNYVWLLSEGNFQATTTSATPEAGADLIATAVTDASTVTSVTQKQTYLHKAQTLEPIRIRRKTGAITATETDAAWAIVPFDCYFVSALAHVKKRGTSTSGSFVFDINTRGAGVDWSTAGTTIFTSQATDDRRLTVGYNENSDETEDAEVIYFAAGTVLSFDIDAVPSGISVNPEDCEIVVLVRRA